MLSQIKILQINGTVLAGIMIIFSLANLDQNYTSDLERLELEHLSFLNEIKEQTEQLNQITKRFSELNKEFDNPELTQEQFDKISEEIDKLSVLLMIDDELYSIDELHKFEQEYVSTKRILEYNISQDGDKDFSNDPATWIFAVGVAFSISSVFAVLALFDERDDVPTNPKFYFLMSYASIVTMLGGFLLLTVVFSSLGFR